MFLALGMSITSTVVTIRVLEELDMIKDHSTILLLGISVIEDIIAITALGLFQSISSSSNGEISIIHISISVSIVAAFVGSILILGSRYIPNVIDMVSKTNDYAILLIVILGLAFGLSFAVKGLGLSVVTGAFLAGVLVAESKNAATARVITIPLRDMFAALFFISVGALMEVSLIPLFIVPAVVFILSSFASKFLIITLILSKLSKYANITALRTGLGMASARGELSLIVAKAGQDTGVVSSAVFPILGVVTIITTFITPYILRFGKQLTITSQDSSYFDNSNNNDKY
jgi:monovalent cation:H+ antiporter-2, CPA2 family